MRGKYVLGVIFVMLSSMSALMAWPLPYNFGSGTGTYTTANTSSTSFLPRPVSGNAYTYCSNGGGGLYWNNPGLSSLGQGSELRLQASSTAIANQFSIENYEPLVNDNSSFTRFFVQFGNASGGNATSGTFYFFLGNDNGNTPTMYHSGIAYQTNQIFAGLRWVINSDGTITTSYMSGNQGSWTTLPSGTCVQGQVYRFELFCNNKNNGNTYTHNGQVRSLSNNKWDLWIDNALVSTSSYSKAKIQNNSALDSFTFTGLSSTGNGGNMYIDEMTYDHTCTSTTVSDPTDYYNRPTGNGALNLTSNWVTNADGSGGKAPTSFTSNYQTFHIQNSSTSTITANWAVSGTSSTVVVGDSTNVMTFTVPSAYTVTAPLTVKRNGWLKLVNTTYPTMSVLETGSTVEYGAGGAQNVPVMGYGNLIISGSGTKTLLGTTTASGNVNVYTGDLQLGNYGLTVSGSTSGAGYYTYNGTGRISGGISSGTNLQLKITGTETLPNPIGNLQINASGVVQLGGNTSVNDLILTSGLTLGANTLTIRGAISGTGGLTGGASSNLNFSGTGASTTLPTVTVNNLTVNRTSGITMGGNVTVLGTLLLSAGNVSLGTNTLTLSGSLTTSTGTLVGGTTSNLIVNGSGIAFSIPAMALNNLSILRSNVVALNGSVTVHGTLDLTGGQLSIGANTLTLNGTVSGSNALVGSSTSSLILGGTGAITLPSLTSLYDFSITRPSTVELSSAMTVYHDFSTATNTNVVTTSVNVLNFAAGATGSGSGNVQGYVRQNSMSISSNGSYTNRYIGLSTVATTSSISNFTLQRTELGNNISGRNSISRTWTIQGTSGASCTVTLSWPVTADNGNIFGYGTIWRNNGTSWTQVTTQAVTTSSGMHTIVFTHTFTGSAADFSIIGANPVISLSTPSLNDFRSIKQGQYSSVQSYTVSGVGLIANLIVSPPSGFQISLSSVAGFDGTISITPTNGIINNVAVYVRFAPNAVGSLSGNITNSSTNAQTQNVYVTGKGINNPLISSPNVNSVSASTVILGSEIDEINYSPVKNRGFIISKKDGFSENEGEVFAEDGSFGVGTYAIRVDGLNRNTTYYFKAFATNDAGTVFSTQGVFQTPYESYTNDYYRTISSGTWENHAIWESSVDGVVWYAATQSPDYQSLGIHICDHDSVRVITNLTVDHLTIDNLAALVIQEGVNMGVHHSDSPSIIQNGSLTVSGALSFEPSAEMTCGNQSIVVYNGNATQTISGSSHYNNLIVNNTQGVNFVGNVEIDGVLTQASGSIAGIVIAYDGFSSEDWYYIHIAESGQIIDNYGINTTIQNNLPLKINRQWSISGSYSGLKEITFYWDETDDNHFNWNNLVPVLWKGTTRFVPETGNYDVTSTRRWLKVWIQSHLTKGDYTIGFQDNTLPVELSSFSGGLTGTSFVSIEWSTHSETDLSGYYLYRGLTNDLTHADRINNFIPATNSSQSMSYNFLDREVEPNHTYWYWLQSNEISGSIAYFGPISVTVLDLSGHDQPIIPLSTSIESIYPNPFNPETNIRVGVKQESFVTLGVYNIRGQLVKQLINGYRNKGTYTVHWNGKDTNGKACASGAYFVKMDTNNKRYVHKILLMK